MSYLCLLYFPSTQLPEVTLTLERLDIFWTIENVSSDRHPPRRLLDRICPPYALSVLTLSAKVDLIRQLIDSGRREFQIDKCLLNDVGYGLWRNGVRGAICLTLEGGNGRWLDIESHDGMMYKPWVLLDSRHGGKDVYPDVGIFLHFLQDK